MRFFSRLFCAVKIIVFAITCVQGSDTLPQMHWRCYILNRRTCNMVSPTKTQRQVVKTFSCLCWYANLYTGLELVSPRYFTHWDKIAAISQTTFSNALSWTKMYEFRLRLLWGLFLRFESTIFQHWFTLVQLVLVPTRRQTIIFTNDG